jgi:hypothetical protein
VRNRATWSAPWSGRDCPGPAPTRRSAVVTGSKTAAGRKRTSAAQVAQTLTTRTAWYGEGNSETASSLLQCRKQCAQPAKLAEASGIKAGWPRLRMRRGADSGNARKVKSLLPGLLGDLKLCFGLLPSNRRRKRTWMICLMLGLNASEAERPPEQ